MPVRKKTSTTRLPQSLQQEIEESVANDHPHNQRHRRTSRKELRQQERAAQKQKKAEYFSQNQNTRKRAAEGDHIESPQRKKPRQNGATQPPAPKTATTLPTKDNATSNVSTVPLPSSTVTTQGSSKRPVKSLASEKRSEKPPKKESLPLLIDPQEEKEDAYIAYLEAQLGMGKSSKRTSKKQEDDDGLDDLMNWADSFVAPKTQHLPTVDMDRSDSSDEYYESEGEWTGIVHDELESDTVEGPPEVDHDDEIVISKPTPSGAYVPPHMRNKRQNSSSEEMQKLTRQLKGLLNRMSEQNIGSIVDSCEEIYRGYRRNDVTTTITNLIINSISSHSSLLDSYVVLYAAFVSSLHKIIGIEFAAHFVQTVVLGYEQHYSSISTSTDVTEQEGKECSNLLVLISELYNFQVISSVLVFDIIRALLDGNFTEFNAELLLKIVRNSGQQLRQDDPSALKDIVQIVQGRVSTVNDRLSSRTRFMIETLTNLKNNKLKRNTTQNQGGAAVERMKKFLSGLGKSRTVLAHDALRVSLDDLHSAETKGKWWLVGAAWSGDPLVDKQADFSKPATKRIEPEVVSTESTDLLKLARSQGMNTDIRRGIFIVLVSSDDYIDACERLSQLNLTEMQQREIIRVLLHCCGNERSYNPYYTLVCQQLCRTSHAYRITLQFSLWDFLRDLGEKSVGGAAVVKNIDDVDDFELKEISESRMYNVARAYAWWIAKDCVTLLILKPVDFTALKARTREFLREMFIHVFVNSQRSTPIIHMDRNATNLTRNRTTIEEIFIKATRAQSLAMGLVYFLSLMSKDKPDSEDEVSKFVHWAVGVAKDTLRSAVDLVSGP